MAEERSDVFSGAGVGEQPGSRVENTLWFLEDAARKAIKDAGVCRWRGRGGVFQRPRRCATLA